MRTVLVGLMLLTAGCYSLRDREPSYDGYSYGPPAPRGSYDYRAASQGGWSQGGWSQGGWYAPVPHGWRAVTFAKSRHGQPYCWGGSGPDCFDCSGLTYAAWRSAGIQIPRTSGEQRRLLTQVSLSHLQPGDVLWRPGHVGLYIGDGWAIHAPGSGKTVRYQPANKYREAVRPQ